MADRNIDIRVRLQEAAKFAADAKKAKQGVKGIGDETERTGRKAKIGSTAIGKMVKRVAALGAAYAGVAGIKDAVNTTLSLGKSTLMLHRNLGLSVESASQLAAVLEVRGLDPKAANTGFTILAKNQQAAIDGGKKQTAMFKTLGITQDDLIAGQSDYLGFLGKIGDRLKDVHGPRKAALASKLLGKSYSQLLPLLAGGTKGLQEQMEMADKYGATLKGKSVKDIRKLIEAQHESEYATLGLKIAVGQTLIPMLTKLVHWIGTTVLYFREHKDAATKLKIALGLLGGAYVITKLAGLVTAIEKIGVALTFLSANPVVLVVGGLLLLVGAFVLLYLKVKGFRDFINKWGPRILAPLLGPLGAAWSAAHSAGDAVGWLGRKLGILGGDAKKAQTHLASLFGIGLTASFNKGLDNLGRGLDTLIGKTSTLGTAITGVETAFQGLTPGGSGPASGFVTGIPGQANGGITRRAGLSIVGENGPELLRMPRGAVVAPLPAGGGLGASEITTNVWLDGKVVAKSVDRHQADRKARR